MIIGFHADSAIQSRGSSGNGGRGPGVTSPAQLDGSLSVPGITGIIEGWTSDQTSHMLTAPAGYRYGEIVTDFHLRVDGFHGHSVSPYALGDTILLRIPGGTVVASGHSLSMAGESAPEVKVGQHIFVFVRDQGKIAGGNAPGILVASDHTDVFSVGADGLVHGQGGWARIAEPLDVFRKHFQC